MAASVKVLQTASNDRLDERNPSVPQNLRSVANSRDSATTNDLLQTLSGRERQILDCLVLGMSNKLIARQLSMAEATVKVHLKALLRKLQAKNRTQAAILAVRSREAARASTAEVISASTVPMPELLASRRPSRPSASLPSINWGFPNISASIARRP
jgi:two-component system nitrate/nitrite response regulator NarL